MLNIEWNLTHRNTPEWKWLTFLYIIQTASNFSQRCTNMIYSVFSQWKWLHLLNPITRVDPFLFTATRCTSRHFYSGSILAHATDSNLNPILVLLSRRWTAILLIFVKCLRILGLKWSTTFSLLEVSQTSELQRGWKRCHGETGSSYVGWWPV